jgi:rhamnogalacturonyl hydrolase YesR
MRHLRFIQAAVPVILLFAGAGDLAGQTISDGAISNAIVTVARHWRQMYTHTPLADGSYPVATNFSQAQSAAKPSGIEWDYQWGLNLHGQLRVYDATGDTIALNFVVNHNLIVARYYAWLMSLTNTLKSKSQLPKFQTTNAVLGTFFQLGKLDYCGSMTSQLLEGTLHHGGPTIQQLQMAMVTANYVSTGQSRLPDGTLYRPTDLNAVWADDLYMSCPFLVRWYLCTGDTNYLDDAARQVMNMAGYLQSTNGLWFHGYYLGTHSVNGIKWGRGNGWAMVSTVEILSGMPTNHPAWTNLLTILRRHVTGVESVEAPDGLWRQVLDDPSAWEDTSCSAMFVFCIARAVNQGWIDSTNLAVARRGFAAIAEKEISPTGVISNICPPTGLSTSLSYYLTTKKPAVDDSHGPGPVMLAGAELLLKPKVNVAAAGNAVNVSWNAGLVNFNLQASTNLANWSNWTDPVVNTNGQNVMTDSNADVRFFRLNLSPPDFPPVPLVYEAESLTRTTNGATATIVTNSGAGGGKYLSFNSAGAGNSITFDLTSVPAGDYCLELAFRAGFNRGMLTLAVAGQPLVGVLDEYWPVGNYPVWSFGPLIATTNGDFQVTLTVTGKNAAASSYAITADKFILVPR